MSISRRFSLPIFRLYLPSKQTWLCSAVKSIVAMAFVCALGTLNLPAQEPKILDKSTPAKPDNDGWIALLPAKGLENWVVTDFYSHGEVVRDGESVVFEPGKPLTGITYAKKDFPKNNFEIEFEARRTSGNDFLCGLTFPVGDEFASFIGGGWGGGLVGLSSVNGADASENNTSSYVDFKNGQWYKFRILVDDEFIRGFVDKKEMFAQERENHKFSTRIEVDESKPLGLCAFRSRVEIKNLKWRTINTESK